MAKEQHIRERAHQLWEQEGRPTGRDKEHWERAARELGGLDEPRHDSPDPGNSVFPSNSGGSKDQAPYASVDPRTERTG